MKEFRERWYQEPKFKAKVELGVYAIFVILVAIFAFSTRPQNDYKQTENNNNNENINEIKTIDIPEKYNYIKNITINDKKYQYQGNVEFDKENIIKTIKEETTNYLYQNKDYYRKESETFILTTKDEVYDIINYNYLDINTINKYLSKSILSKEKHLVYLKDIILDNNSNDYIIIEINKEKINIDYTALIKYYDETIERCLVEIIIEEIE